jgi:L-amino acid N-acyltransferase YncA
MRVANMLDAHMSMDLAPSARVRPARPADAEAIARIYNHGIEDGIATFQNEPRTVADIEHMLEQRADHFPTVVVERDGQIVAWASAGTYRATAWYAPILEHSVYVDRDQRGTGVGTIALNALIDEAERLGFLKLVSRIFVENAASRALHLKCGFREVGIYRRHGKLNGVWHDCVIVERLLRSAGEDE